MWTARVSYGGADRLDITRKSAGPAGLPFAPSWGILRPALDARKRATAVRCAMVTRDDLGDADQEADRIEADAWARYVPAYTAEMRASYQTNVEAWGELLARREVTLVCYCTDAARCHRRLLAAMLAKCGAVDEGEQP